MIPLVLIGAGVIANAADAMGARGYATSLRSMSDVDNDLRRIGHEVLDPHAAPGDPWWRKMAVGVAGSLPATLAAMNKKVGLPVLAFYYINEAREQYRRQGWTGPEADATSVTAGLMMMGMERISELPFLKRFTAPLQTWLVAQAGRGAGTGGKLIASTLVRAPAELGEEGGQSLTPAAMQQMAGEVWTQVPSRDIQAEAMKWHAEELWDVALVVLPLAAISGGVDIATDGERLSLASFTKDPANLAILGEEQARRIAELPTLAERVAAIQAAWKGQSRGERLEYLRELKEQAKNSHAESELEVEDAEAESSQSPNTVADTGHPLGSQASEPQPAPVSNANPYRTEDGALRVHERPGSWSDPALQAYQDKLKAIVDDEAEADRRYDAIPASKGGKVIGTDIARELLPEYAANREGKIEYVHATGRLAQAYAKDRLWREIENPRGRSTLMFTAGGVAAGKSTAVGEEIINARDLVFDGTLREADWAIKTIERAIEKGWKVTIHYVQRPLEQAVLGAIERAQESGRWGSIAVLPKSHLEAQRSILKIAKHFKGNQFVRVNLWLNEGQTTNDTPKSLTLEQIDERGKYSYNTIYEPRLDRKGNSGGPGVVSEKLREAERDTVRRVFAAAVASGRYERRILRLVAQGDAELERIADAEGLDAAQDGAEIETQKAKDSRTYNDSALDENAPIDGAPGDLSEDDWFRHMPARKNQLGAEYYENDGDLNELRKELESAGVELALDSDDILKARGIAAGFQALGPGKGRMLFKKNPTRREVLHELVHFRQFRDLGYAKYLKLRESGRHEMGVLEWFKENPAEWDRLSESEKRLELKNHEKWELHNKEHSRR